MLARFMVGAGLFTVGYLLGKELGRTEPIREQLQRNRQRRAADAATGESEPATPNDKFSGKGH